MMTNWGMTFLKNALKSQWTKCNVHTICVFSFSFDRETKGSSRLVMICIYVNTQYMKLKTCGDKQIGTL